MIRFEGCPLGTMDSVPSHSADTSCQQAGLKEATNSWPANPAPQVGQATATTPSCSCMGFSRINKFSRPGMEYR